MRLKQEQIEEIRRLRATGLHEKEIAAQLGISQTTVNYWLQDDDTRKEISHRAHQRFMRKSIDERRIVYQKRKDYMRNYLREYMKSHYSKKEVKS
jgi:orotate phosphoribosyltransferase-like protein